MQSATTELRLGHLSEGPNVSVLVSGVLCLENKPNLNTPNHSSLPSHFSSHSTTRNLLHGIIHMLGKINPHLAYAPLLNRHVRRDGGSLCCYLGPG